MVSIRYLFGFYWKDKNKTGLMNMLLLQNFVKKYSFSFIIVSKTQF